MQKKKKKKKKLGVTYLVSQIKCVENYPDFGIQHGLWEFIVKNIEDEPRRQTILVIFCGSESVA